MKSPREIKAEKVDRFKGLVGDAKAIVLADYKGLPVEDMETLRRKLRDAGGQVAVIKNTLAKVALDDLGVEELHGDLTGQIAFVFSERDAVVGTKAAHEFAKGNNNFKLVSGFFDGRRMTLEEVISLANLPSREELQAMLVGVLMAPLVDVVATLQAPVQEFLGTLDARARKLEDQGETQAAA